MINDLIDFSSILAGKLSIKNEDVNLLLAINNCCSYLKEKYEKKGIKINIISDKDVKIIDGDCERIEQIIINLLSNAISFSPENEEITILLENSNGTHFSLKVTDKGEGIDPAFLPNIFTKFSQDKSLNRNHKGLGLGLYIVHDLTKAHGGKISCESFKGIGTTFTLIFPQKDLTLNKK